MCDRVHRMNLLQTSRVAIHCFFVHKTSQLNCTWSCTYCTIYHSMHTHNWQPVLMNTIYASTIVIKDTLEYNSRVAFQGSWTLTTHVNPAATCAEYDIKLARVATVGSTISTSVEHWGVKSLNSLWTSAIWCLLLLGNNSQSDMIIMALCIGIMVEIWAENMGRCAVHW